MMPSHRNNVWRCVFEFLWPYALFMLGFLEVQDGILFTVVYEVLLSFLFFSICVEFVFSQNSKHFHLNKSWNLKYYRITEKRNRLFFGLAIFPIRWLRYSIGNTFKDFRYLVSGKKNLKHTHKTWVCTKYNCRLF